MIKEWMDFLTATAFGVIPFISLFEGTRLLRVNGINRMSLLMIAFGAIYCFSSAGFTYWKHTVLTELRTNIEKVKIVNLKSEDWFQGMDPKNREKASLSMAQMYFVNTGRIGHYFDFSGQRKDFSPSEQDIRNRDTYVVALARHEDSVRSTFNEALAWLIWAVVATGLGVIFGSNKAHTLANPTEKNGNGTSDSP